MKHGFMLLWKTIAVVETFQSQLTAGVGQTSIKSHKEFPAYHPMLLALPASCSKK